MFSKIGNMLGKAWDFGSSLIKPIKNHISNGWESLKNGASKVGKFVSDNHETIGTILSGVGNIIGNLPNSPLKQKLKNYGETAQGAGNFMSGGFSNLRPANTQRQSFSNGLTNRMNQPRQQAAEGVRGSMIQQQQQPQQGPMNMRPHKLVI